MDMDPAPNMDAAFRAGLNSGTAVSLPESLDRRRRSGNLVAIPPAAAAGSAPPPTA